MFRRLPWAWPLALLTAWAAAAAPNPDTSPIVDEAGLFSPDAVRKATDIIREIERTDHQQLVIETQLSKHGILVIEAQH